MQMWFSLQFVRVYFRIKNCLQLCTQDSSPDLPLPITYMYKNFDENFKVYRLHPECQSDNNSSLYFHTIVTKSHVFVCLRFSPYTVMCLSIGTP